MLPYPIARMISSLAMASLITLRFTNRVVDTTFETLKFSAAASFGIGRRAVVTALSSARNIHLLTLPSQPHHTSDAISFFTVLDAYTNFGISCVHTTFSLAELVTLTSFHLTNQTVKFSLTVFNF